MKIHKKRSTILLIIISCAMLLGGCGKEKQTADFSGVTSVCELATLKCYYHNVAKYFEEDASGALWWKKIESFGLNTPASLLLELTLL